MDTSIGLETEGRCRNEVRHASSSCVYSHVPLATRLPCAVYNSDLEELCTKSLKPICMLTEGVLD